ncbi:MAG: hypothetical protein QM784_21650 [Polyangiaceae bacterium]
MTRRCDAFSEWRACSSPLDVAVPTTRMSAVGGSGALGGAGSGGAGSGGLHATGGAAAVVSDSGGRAAGSGGRAAGGAASTGGNAGAPTGGTPAGGAATGGATSSRPVVDKASTDATWSQGSRLVRMGLSRSSSWINLVIAARARRLP